MKSKKWITISVLSLFPIIVKAQKKIIQRFDCGYAASVGNVKFDSITDSFILIRTYSGDFALYIDVLSCNINNTKSSIIGVLTYPPLKYESKKKKIKVSVFLAKSEDGESFKVIDTLTVMHLYEKVHLSFKAQNNLYIIVYAHGFKSTVLKTGGFEYIK